MADAQDSKSCEGDFVWVQVPLSAVKKALTEDSISSVSAFITCRYNAVYKPKYKYSVRQYDKSIGLYH